MPTEDRILISQSDVDAMMWSREIRRTVAKVTNLNLMALVGGKYVLDQLVEWSPAMPSKKYKVTVLNGVLPAGMTAVPLEDTYELASCKVRISSTALITLGQQVDLTAWV